MKHSASGFALLEILVALAFIAGAVTALLLRMQSISNTVSFIEERTVAYWVAENIMQEKLADQVLQKNIQRLRRDKDMVEFDGRDWHWSSEVKELPLEKKIFGQSKLYQIDIEVGVDPDKPKATLTGFAGEL